MQVQVLEGALVLLRPLVKEGEGELWVMLQDGREYRLRLVVGGDKPCVPAALFSGATTGGAGVALGKRGGSQPPPCQPGGDDGGGGGMVPVVAVVS
ncbi:hypothetical protein CSW38_11390 [Thermus scotoductus]|uniref:Uncharacterized protein n=1 Tax=Thermus scotoductus TaxID=37636 RepID=A0A430RTZ5_THESC|nr:hypothetical protein CSW38_11390 [Thermus scotoductus]